jgi:hypothetical protein
MKKIRSRPGQRWIRLAVGMAALTGLTWASGFAVDDGGPPPAAASTSCPDADCDHGPPPAAGADVECSDPKCLPGTLPDAAPQPGSRVSARIRPDGASDRTAGAMSTAMRVASTDAGTSNPINCPPSAIGGDGPGC